MNPTPSQRDRESWISLAVWLLPLVAVLATLGDPGPTWDEPFYIGASTGYLNWFQELPHGSFRAGARDGYWQFNHEHPPLTKLAIGLSERAFGPWLGITLAGRLVGALAFATLVLLTYRLTRRVWGRMAGLFAAAALVLMPRLFGHAHFAGLDVPMALAWLATTYAFWLAVDDRTGSEANGENLSGRKVLPRTLFQRLLWTLAAGALFGLSLLTKINAVLLPLALWPWGLLVHRRRAAPAIAAMAVLGPLIFVGGWPWLWTQTATRAAQFFLGTTGRSLVPVYYFGRAYAEQPAPWHYPWVLTLATVPLGLLALAVYGGWDALKQGGASRRAALLLLVGVLVPLTLLSIPGGRGRYDGVRLFLTIFPLLACLAGVGAAAAVKWLSRRLRPRLSLGVVALLVALQGAGIVLTHPHELSCYNALVGSVPGANALGLETTYWGDSCDWVVFGFLKAHASEGATVVFRPVGEYVFQLYEMDRYVKGIRPVHEADSYAYLVLIARQGMFAEGDWRLYREGHPVLVRRVLGVPTCLVYAASR